LQLETSEYLQPTLPGIETPYGLSGTTPSAATGMTTTTVNRIPTIITLSNKFGRLYPKNGARAILYKVLKTIFVPELPKVIRRPSPESARCHWSEQMNVSRNRS
jgi:hypothetical protein